MIFRYAFFTLAVFTCFTLHAQTTRPDVHEALASTRDVWGELAMAQPNGPSYEFFEKLLPPLRYVNTDFRHYPIALAAPFAPVKARLVSNGCGVNLPCGTKTWYDYPLGVRFKLGDGEEEFGSDLARLTGPAYEKGYLPIVQMKYRVGDSVVAQEAFADGTSIYVRFSLVEKSPLSIKLAIVGDEKLLRLSKEWKDNAGTLKPNAPLLLAVFNKTSLPTEVLDEVLYQKLRASCSAQWEQLLARCMTLDVPEERVNRAWKSTLIGNLMMASGDEMTYSSGNIYQRMFEAESGDVQRALLVYGLTDEAKKMVDPLLKYKQEGLGFHDAAFKLQMLAHVYWITRDAKFIESKRELWRPSIDLILNQREKETGLLPKENYCGDIHTQVYSLNSNANCWRALRDMSAVLRDLGNHDEADSIQAAAIEFRNHIFAALQKSQRRDVKPTFIPIALFGAEQPYEKLTDSMLGSYWNLMIPYVLGSEILDDEQTTAALDYLHTRGGMFAGLIRFHQHSGLFANEDGVDDLYGLRYIQTLLHRDEVDRVLVSFYGKLAHGLTRDTFIGGEGTGLIPLDANGRAMYLPPNASGNGFFLAMLREMLVQDVDDDGDGKPDSLRLLNATPRAWLEDGKTIRIERTPTAFGPVSIVARSGLSHGRIVVDITEPPRVKPPIKLRVRTPDGWKVTAASTAGVPLKLDDKSTVTLPVAWQTFSVEFTVSR